MFINFLLVALGGGIGACGRYGAGLIANSLIHSEHILYGFPIHTMIVNILGCFIIGFVSHFLSQSSLEHKDLWQLFAITGCLGGFTTFSSFSLESITLISSGKQPESIIYIFGTIIVCLLGALAGRALAQLIWNN